MNFCFNFKLHINIFSLHTKNTRKYSNIICILGRLEEKVIDDRQFGFRDDNDDNKTTIHDISLVCLTIEVRNRKKQEIER